MSSVSTPTSDTTTQGNWVGKYGASDYILCFWDGVNTASTPDLSGYSPASESLYTWAYPTTDVRALTNLAGTSRAASCWYAGGTFTCTITFGDSFTGTLSVYSLDWDPAARAQNLKLAVGASSATATLAAGSFENGLWTCWPIVASLGDVFTLTVTYVSGPNAVISGIFLDGEGGGGGIISVSQPAVASITTGSTIYDFVLSSLNPLAWWKLADASGSIAAADASGNNYTGASLGGITFAQTGPIASQSADTAVLFSGTGGIKQASNAAALQLSVGTIMAWINTTSPGASYQGIIVKQLAYSLFLASDILTYYDWSLSTAVSTGLNLADGNWHFVAISFQSGVSSGTVVYVDGSPVLTSIMTISSQSNPLGIGTGEAGSGQNITGTIAQAAVFGSILAATTINNLWQVANGHYSSPTSLFFPFLGS